jgi:hypothetical protein
MIGSHSSLSISVMVQNLHRLQSGEYDFLLQRNYVLNNSVGLGDVVTAIKMVERDASASVSNEVSSRVLPIINLCQISNKTCLKKYKSLNI